MKLPYLTSDSYCYQAPLVAKNGEWEVISADYEPFDATDNSEDELDVRTHLCLTNREVFSC